MLPVSSRGSSLIETLVALALTASASAALLPSLAVASRLHRDSEIETDGAIVGAARIERIAADVAAGALSAGGRLDAGAEGWNAWTDRSGAEVAAERAVFEVRWQVVPLDAASGVVTISVRVIPIASRGAVVTLAVAVADE